MSSVDNCFLTLLANIPFYLNPVIKWEAFLAVNIHAAYLEKGSKCSIWESAFPLLPAKHFHSIMSNSDKHIAAWPLNAELTLRNRFGKQFESLWRSRFQTGMLQSREGKVECWSVTSLEFMNVKREFHLSLVWVHQNHLCLSSCVRIKKVKVFGAFGVL